MATPFSDVRLSLGDIRFVGSALVRPECVISTRSGALYASDKRGGVARVGVDGAVSVIGQGNTLLPNGIALLRDGSFAVANLSDEGGVWRLKRDGSTEPLLTEVDGKRLPSVNFVWLDAQERLWVCVSTVRKGDHQFRDDIADGFIVLRDGHGARVVADGICWTNECRIDAAQNWFYVNETFGRRLTRFRLKPDGSLSGRETVTAFGPGTYPDGLEIDVEGCLWVISVVSNRVIRVTPDGKQALLLEDLDRDHVDRLEVAFRSHTLSRPMVWDNHSEILQNITSIAFGGSDLRTLYLGCLSGQAIATIRSPVAGRPAVHWNWA
jgi:sugar lactone lactonase YvrE